MLCPELLQIGDGAIQQREEQVMPAFLPNRRPAPLVAAHCLSDRALSLTVRAGVTAGRLLGLAQGCV